MTESIKGVALQATSLLMMFVFILLVHVLQAEATVIKDLRFGKNKGYLRMVLEFDRPFTPTPSVSIDGNALQVTLTGVSNNQIDTQIGKDNTDIIRLDVSQKSDTIQVETILAFTPTDVKTFSLGDPHRFIIDAYRPISAATTKPLVEKERHIAGAEKTVSSTELSSEREKLHPASASPSMDEISIKAEAATSPRSGKDDELRRKRFQQRLIAALIVVTSIIAVLLFLLIWMGDNRKKTAKPSWIGDLPPTTDRDIESIDAVIGKHLKSDDRR